MLQQLEHSTAKILVIAYRLMFCFGPLEVKSAAGLAILVE
jgi:hypothetical protein